MVKNKCTATAAGRSRPIAPGDFIEYHPPTRQTAATFTPYRTCTRMIEVEDHIYDYPQYYDLIFGADWKPELQFLEAAFDKFVDGAVDRLFEPACGTGRLIYRFADAGYNISGNDLNAKAVAFCNDRLKQHGLNETAVVGDMTQFTVDQQADAGFNTINSFRHLQTQQQAIDHLNCMAAAIRPGGIYVLGFHLTPTASEAIEEEYWSASADGLTVESGMWLNERNLSQRFEKFGMSFDVQMPDEQFRIVDEVKFRTWTWPQFESLIKKVPALELVSIYDFEYDIKSPTEVDDQSEDVVFVLKVK